MNLVLLLPHDGRPESDRKAVSQYLGHASTDTTTKFYQQSKLKPGDIFNGDK
jgi:hypothetical protein